MTDDPVMHALVDLVEQLSNVGMDIKLAKAYANAMVVIRGRSGLRPEVAPHMDTVRLDELERSKCYPFWNGDRWIYIVAPERSAKADRRGEGPTVREAIDAAIGFP